MNVLIIEDETAAAVNLQAILKKVAPTYNVLAILEEVSHKEKDKYHMISLICGI